MHSGLEFLKTFLTQYKHSIRKKYIFRVLFGNVALALVARHNSVIFFEAHFKAKASNRDKYNFPTSKMYYSPLTFIRQHSRFPFSLHLQQRSRRDFHRISGLLSVREQVPISAQPFAGNNTHNDTANYVAKFIRAIEIIRSY